MLDRHLRWTESDEKKPHQLEVGSVSTYQTEQMIDNHELNKAGALTSTSITANDGVGKLVAVYIIGPYGSAGVITSTA